MLRSRRLLGSLLRPHRRSLALAALLITCNVAAQLAGPLRRDPPALAVTVRADLCDQHQVTPIGEGGRGGACRGVLVGKE